MRCGFTMAQMATETQDVRLPVKPVKLDDGRTVNSSEKFDTRPQLLQQVVAGRHGLRHDEPRRLLAAAP